MLRMENSAYFVASCGKISSASGLFILDSFKIDREGKRRGSRKTISFSGNGVCEMIRPQNENTGYADRIHEEMEAAIAQEMRPLWNTPARVRSLIGDNAVHSQTNASATKRTSYFQLKLA